MNNNIEICYRVFSPYPLKRKIDGCPCCKLNAAEEGLHKKDLRDLEWSDLEDFIFKSMTTFGDVEDFKHFLPRILELYITDFYGAPYDIGILFSKLDYGDWRNWEIKEFETVSQLLGEWLNCLKSSGSQNDKTILENIYMDMETFKFEL